MDTTTLIGVFSLLVLGVVSAGLALWCEYHDGVFGHLALAVMALCSLAVGVDALDTDYQFLPTTSATFAAMMLFMLRHAYRAWRYRHGSPPT